MHVARHNTQGNVVPTIIGNNVTIGKPLPTCVIQLSTATCEADVSPAYLSSPSKQHSCAS